MQFTETAEFFSCPGVADDTANLAVMMICARYYLQNKVPSPTGILFVANSCEEGLGNLKGCRAIVDRYGHRMDTFVTFDGFSLNKVACTAVGSHRYRVRIRTEGGHSYGAFGNRNAIYYLSSMITTFYSIKVPQEGNSKTTYNVGLISGGTSVNTIAQEAEMLFEHRSDNRNCLAKMETLFRNVIATYRDMGVEVDVELVGDRPCSSDVDPIQMEKLKQFAAESIQTITGQVPEYYSSSTDCNIPLSRGIPAICIGLCVATGIHTRSEKLNLASLPMGSAYCMDFLSKFYSDISV
jgi:acetylornithine deacetylase/succinyl-diaminopimelate desuccinylase-like protein